MQKNAPQLFLIKRFFFITEEFYAISDRIRETKTADEFAPH
jgi:hypothetical protein